MPTPENFSRLFRNLAHMVALSREEKVAGVVDSLVTTVLTIDSSIDAKTPSDVVEAVDVYFGLRFKDGDLQSSIDRLIGGGHLQRAPGGTLVPAPQARAEIDLRVAKRTINSRTKYK